MKRFIAGAVCPQCQALDRLVLQSDDRQDPPLMSRRCVDCGFFETLDAAPKFSLPSTIKERKSEDSDNAQIVRILDPDSPA